MATIHETILSVPDISCEQCVKTITGALGVLPGVAAVTPDISTRTVHLRYDPQQVAARDQAALILPTGA